MVADAGAVLGQYAASTQAGATLDVWVEGDSVVLVTAGATADTGIIYQLDDECRRCRRHLARCRTPASTP